MKTIRTLLALSAILLLTQRATAQQPQLPAVQAPPAAARALNARVITGKVVTINRRNGTIIVQEGDGEDKGGDKGGGKPPKLLLNVAQLPASALTNLKLGDLATVQYSVLQGGNAARSLQMPAPSARGPSPAEAERSGNAQRTGVR